MIFYPGLRYFALLILLATISQRNESQVLADTSTLKLVKTAVDQIYSMRFAEASGTARIISEKYPGHPVTYLLNGMIIYWEDFPLLSGTDRAVEFEKQMRTCIEKSDNHSDGNEAEFLLSSLCARGSLLVYYTGNNLSSKVFSLGRTSYRYVRRSFEFRDSFPDFLFFTGLYNYYREAYAGAHPIYRPLMALFPRGDREKGMYELRKAFSNSIFLKAEASTFLSSNYKYFENDYKNALYFSRLIFQDYPANIIYRINCIEDLLLTKQYDEAEKLLQPMLAKKERNYFQAQVTILDAILSEKKKNIEGAEKSYRRGIEMISEFNDYGNQYSAYAWFGLSRISAFRNDEHNERVYRRKAHELTDFENVSFD